MRKISIYILFVVSALTTACSDHLDTEPSASVGAEQIFSTPENALTAINGIYRALYISDWGTDWKAENGGLPAYTLASNLMGEDMIQTSAGSGWFYYDYAYGIDGDFTSSAGRQYQTWNFFYQLISNSNNVIANEETWGTGDMASYVLGQAYAIRALAYSWLVQNFCQNDPTYAGVPIYTEPTTIKTEGKPRGKVADVYTQINNDLSKAISHLSATTSSRQHISHIDLSVAYGFKARACLMQQDYEGALQAAKAAIENTSAKFVDFTQVRNVNDVAKANVMWGVAIQPDQSLGSYGIYYHIDADANTTYSKGTRFIISKWLYDQIPDTDSRIAWWTAPNTIPDPDKPSTSQAYIQTKLISKDPVQGTGDYVFMRIEEMYLAAAEAACHLEQYEQARSYMSWIAEQRDSEYEERLSKFVDQNTITPETSTVIRTLMDEILFQRRIELWGEVSRMHDLQRLGLGLNRKYSESNHVSLKEYPVAHTRFIYRIPQKELDGNTSMTSADQNP